MTVDFKKSARRLLLLGMAFLAAPAMAGEIVSREAVSGVNLLVMKADLNAKYDVSLMPEAEVRAKLSKAMGLIRERSRFASQSLARLGAKGAVFIIYDPDYPPAGQGYSKVKVAGFSSQYEIPGTKPGAGPAFMAIVGRHGIKWPLEDLAAILVHELVGHGIQHMEGRWDPKRLRDMECEAWLYESKAYQDFGRDRMSSDMIRFQKQLSRQCAGFIAYLHKSDIAGLGKWEQLNRDIPAVLTHFRGYERSLRP